MSIERSTNVPEGAKAVTAQDIISVAVPERMESVEYWLVKSSMGITETIRIRPEIGETCQFQQSPLDGSFLALKFTFKGGPQNERSGEQFFPMNNVFFWSFATVKEAVYKDGESPAALELKRREKIRAQQIEAKAAQLSEGLDEDE